VPFACGSHQVVIYARGGLTPLFELAPVSSVRWQRIRDDISTASATIPTQQCCDELGDLRAILHELHLVRDGVTVWQGPITRVEYEFEQVQIYAEDVLWQAKRMVLEQGYSQASPNQWNVVDRMHWLLNDQCYWKNGDPWHVTPHLHPIHGPSDPMTTRVTNAYQYTIWEDFDSYAENSGTDYTVVNRDIYYFDNQLAWHVIPDLDENYISQFPRVVEYGNSAATRHFITNGEGQAGWATQPDLGYGLVDTLSTRLSEGNTEGPTAEDIQNWRDSAAHHLSGLIPSPISVVIPANTTLLPGAAWTIEQLIPGSWFQINVETLCRTAVAWQRLHEVVVTEEAPAGESVQFTAVSPPTQMFTP